MKKFKRYTTLLPEFAGLAAMDSQAPAYIQTITNPFMKKFFTARMDAEPLSVFAQNELTQIMAQAYERKTPLLKAKSLFPMKAGMNPGAKAWAFDRWNGVGEADFIDAQGHDMNRADVSKKRETNPIRTIAIAYGYTIEDLLAAQFAGQPLDTKKAERAMRAMDKKEDTLILFGDDSRSIPGALTNPGTPRVILANGAWTIATAADDMLEDMFALVNSVFVTSLENHSPGTLALPLNEWNIISQKPRSTTSDTTVLEFFLRTNRHVNEVVPLEELASVSGLPGRAMFAYEKDPINVEAISPMSAQQQQPPQVKGFETLIPVVSKQGGAVWYYPFAGAFGLL